MDKVQIALAFIASRPGNILEALGKQKAGIVLLCSALAIGGTAGSMVSNLLTWGPRIEDMEEWRDDHLEQVTEPSLVRLDGVIGRQASFEADWNEKWSEGGDLSIMRDMLYELYCARWPSRCMLQP